MLYALKKAPFIATCSLFLLLSLYNHVFAGGAYFDISFDRCVAIDSPEGNKKFSAIGDNVTVNKKGRLWLTGNETREGFVEIVCQNLSPVPVRVEMTSAEMPWISVADPASCKDWQKNILICAVGDMPKGVFCKINERTVVAADEGARKQASASVNVRAVELRESGSEGVSEQQYLQERIEYYAAGIDLCYTMYEKTGDIVVNWIIYGGGAVDKVTLDSRTVPEDDKLANCIMEQIPAWRFPKWEKDSQVSYQF